MNKLKQALLAIALSLMSSVAQAQVLSQLPRTTAAVGMRSDSALTLISDSARTHNCCAASIAELRKAIYHVGADSARAVPANGLTGTTLASNVVTSSLTSLGTLTALNVTGATVTGLTAASVGAGTFPAGAFGFAGAVTNTGGQIITVGDLQGVFKVRNTATTDVLQASTVKGWLGSGSVTDAAIGAIAGLSIYSNSSTTSSLTFGASQAVTFAGALSGITALAASGLVATTSNGAFGSATNSSGDQVYIFRANDHHLALDASGQFTTIDLQHNGVTQVQLYWDNTNSLFNISSAIKLGGALSGVTTVTGTGAMSGFTTANFSSAVTAAGFTLSGTSTKIIAPATSLLIRDNGDANTNVTITDAGALTTRAGVTATGFTLTTAASQIIPGATSLSLRNNANNADNIIVADSGAATVRSTILGLGSGKARMLSNRQTVNNGNSIFLTVGPSGSVCAGILIVENEKTTDDNVRTLTVYAVVMPFTGGTASFASLSTADGASGGATFAVSSNVTGSIQLTNTSGVATTVTFYWFGGDGH